MNDRLLDKYTDRLSDNTDVSGIDNLVVDDLGAFGWLRGSRERAVALELRKSNGNIKAIPYSWIEEFDYDPSEGITILARGRGILIRGRHLNAEFRPQLRLFEGLARARVPWVLEADQAAVLTTARNTPLIESIEW